MTREEKEKLKQMEEEIQTWRKLFLQAKRDEMPSVVRNLLDKARCGATQDMINEAFEVNEPLVMVPRHILISVINAICEAIDLTASTRNTLQTVRTALAQLNPPGGKLYRRGESASGCQPGDPLYHEGDDS